MDVGFDWGRGVAKKKSALGPRRTREHVIASLSHNYIERFFLDKGHTASRPADDYGTDMLVNTFDIEGYAEAGEIRIQLKAKDQFHYSKDNSYVSIKIETKHVHLWMKEPMPVFLILYDAKACQAFWLYVQVYFASNKPSKKAKTVTVRVPVKNKFTEQTVDYMWERKAAILEAGVEHEE